LRGVSEGRGLQGVAPFWFAPFGDGRLHRALSGSGRHPPTAALNRETTRNGDDLTRELVIAIPAVPVEVVA
jgi:hypothetical protein